ncbi:DUF938 domain-containing protein [Undibacterium sp. LX15W]|uniref:DUF938 domain-containing protein n=2 Tax=Undibacterium flavidum TaxID=2762297 RepID=A0ABR6Y9H0_9BURK|nr:DUF938 domain-containing protein [Undibacterium flavidum]
MHTQKQFSLACERNQEPILQHLQEYLADAQQVLEIGSGTGQHAVYFSRHLPHLKWQTSDRVENHPSIQAWINEEGNSRALAPLALDVANDSWPTQSYDAVFTANTCHIMHWEEVEKMFAGACHVLAQNGKFIIYGPFNYGGQFTSISNQEFDASLKRQSSHRGIRDIADVEALAAQQQFKLLADLEMPANNRLLIFKKTT